MGLLPERFCIAPNYLTSSPPESRKSVFMKLYSFHKKVRPLLDFLNVRSLDWKVITIERGFHVLCVHDSIGETSYLKSFFDLLDRESLSYSYSIKMSCYLIF